ncbi:multidrug resistance-associated ABC transporter [Mycena polygramma]|nr:multidrug resistance-associated ABC transporter [Mycena polygramma]
MNRRIPRLFCKACTIGIARHLDGPAVRPTASRFNVFGNHLHRVLPAYVAVASASFIVGRWASSKFAPKEPSDSCPTEHSANRNGRPAVFDALKLLACTTLVVLQLTVATTVAGGWENIALCIAFAYATLLASAPLVSHGDQFATSIHLNVVLLVSLGSYVYRDILCFATFTLIPRDLDEGWLLWAKILVLAVAAIAIPLFRPRLYIPVDPENPMSTPNAEQTCSLFSSLTCSYLDSLIFLAYKQGGLSFYQLPTLADADSAEHLIRRTFPVLDPQSNTSSTYLLYGLFRVYRSFLFTMLHINIDPAKVLLQFAGPVVMNRLLKYVHSGPHQPSSEYARRSLETEETFVRPWIWVVSLFFVPVFHSIVQSRYTWIATRQKTQAEGILIQLLFTHSLRIRVNSETKDNHKRNLIGRINNLATSDVAYLTDVLELWITRKSDLAIWFLYLILGWSSFVGFAIILMTLPLPSYLARKMQTFQVSARQKTDARVQQVTETMTVLRMIKWFAWESKIKEDIAAKRDEELTSLRDIRLLVVLNNCLNFVIPLVVMLATFSAYTLVMGQELTASIVFSSLAVFDGILRVQIRNVMNRVHVIIQGMFKSISARIFELRKSGKVSLDRVDNFLRTTELLDSYSLEDPAASVVEEDANKIGIRDAEFSWSNQVNDSSYKLRIGSDIVFQPGAVNLIVGPTGVGKTAMLLALLGELHFTPAGPNPWVNLPRQGGVAYASQQPWVENATIRENIIFNSSVPFNETRYKRVLYACALYPDLELFEAGDETEVGERGLTLSGGQKARVSLARAIYSPASTILLDDVLASLDIHTSKWVVHNCLSSDLLQGRTVILVTHNVALACPISKWVVSLSLDGSVVQGPVDTVFKNDQLASAVEVEEERTEDVEPTSDSKDSAPIGKLIVAEKSQQGMVKWPTYKLFLANLSSRPISFLCLICGLLLLNEAATSFQSWFLGFWSSQYINRPASSVQAPLYLAVICLSVVTAMVFYIAAYVIWAFGTMRTTKIIHAQLIDCVTGATLRWLDTTPMSRVITRATQDMSKVDNNFPLYAVNFMEFAIFLMVKLAAIMILSPAFILPGAAIALLSVLAGRIYMVAQLPIQRQMSAARSPLLAHFAAGISGLTSIRAYGVEEAFLRESAIRIDLFIRPAISYWNLNRWISIRSDFLGGVFSASLGWYLVYGGGSHYGPANIGFSLASAVSFTSMILIWVRTTNSLELNGKRSLGLISSYIDIEQEPKPSKSGVPPAYWPASGELRADHLSARYSEDGPEILHDLSFYIKSGERIGIVGRTGSGKSSLTLALLRCIPTEGKIYYDGVALDTINLDALRSQITIIPQIPELLAGSLRRNLDPFEAHEDSVLNDALRAAGLFSIHKDGDKSSLTLDSIISSAGGNLSLGERQVVALARAIVRGSKLLILDEDTLPDRNATDYRTDGIIQSTLRNELEGITVLAVAHRLTTIMDYDRIMVLGAGRIIEFDTPLNLLKHEAGHLRRMVDESSDRDMLLAMAEGTGV